MINKILFYQTEGMHFKRRIKVVYILIAVMIVFVAVLIPDSHSQTNFTPRFRLPEKNDSIARDSVKTVAHREFVIDSVITFGKKFLGLHYKSGGSTPSGFDCSGYVSYLFHKFGYSLPHSSSGMATVGEKIDIKKAKPGDLICFKGRSTKTNRVGHVALIIAADSGQITMMHSCHRGVMIEKYNNSPYYTHRFMMCRRVNL
jgi:murein DD-endopeptidase / murein LD-carboxypeptidase